MHEKDIPSVSFNLLIMPVKYLSLSAITIKSSEISNLSLLFLSISILIGADVQYY